jgi:hypothetical protein
MLRVVRTTAIKARTQALNALHELAVTAPDQLRADLAGLNGRQPVSRCDQLEPTQLGSSTWSTTPTPRCWPRPPPPCRSLAICPATNHPGPNQTRDHLLPQALPGPRSLRRPPNATTA